jgi:hypothetical protein
MTKQTAFLLFSVVVTGTCSWELFRSIKTDSVWVRNRPRIARAQQPAIYWINVVVTAIGAVAGAAFIVWTVGVSN